MEPSVHPPPEGAANTGGGAEASGSTHAQVCLDMDHPVTGKRRGVFDENGDVSSQLKFSDQVRSLGIKS